MDINPSLQICGWNVNRIGPDGSAFCPGALKRVPSDSGKHLRVYTSSHICHSHEWHVDTATRQNSQKNGMRVKTSADQQV